VSFLTARDWQERRIRARIFEANHARKPDKTLTIPSHGRNKVKPS